MAYYLYEITMYPNACPPGWASNPMVFPTKEQLMWFWQTKRFKADMLNMNGNDTVTCLDSYVTWSPKNGTEYRNRIKTLLRPLMVTDENGRIQDIRQWNVTPIEPSRDYSLSWRPGAKNHYHRVSGPSLFRRTYQQSCDTDSIEINGEACPVPAVRKKSFIRPADTYDFYERKHFHRRSRSWKDQTTANRQYNKHKTRGNKTTCQNNAAIWANLAADGFPIDPRLLGAA